MHTRKVRIAVGDFERLARGEELTLPTTAAESGGDHGHVVFLRYPRAAAKVGDA